MKLNTVIFFIAVAELILSWFTPYPGLGFTNLGLAVSLSILSGVEK